MAVTVLIPTPLRAYVGGRDAVQVEATSVAELLDRLSGEHTALRKHLFADDGRLRSFVNVYVNDRDIRQLSAQETPVRAGDTVSLSRASREARLCRSGRSLPRRYPNCRTRRSCGIRAT